MVRATFFLFVCLMSCAALHSQSSPVTSKPKQSGTPSKTTTKAAEPLRAEWNESVESFVGITHDQFIQAGLAKLTKDEFASLFLTIYDTQQKAVDNAKKTQITYICGPVPSNYDKVKLYVEVSDGTPAEIASGVRQRLRGLTDVEIVYTPLEADKGIGILGFEDQMESGRKTGYSASVSTYSPCKGSFGDQEWPIKLLDNHFITTAAKASEVIDSIVSLVDTNDIEATRKFHAALKKAPISK